MSHREQTGWVRLYLLVDIWFVIAVDDAAHHGRMGWVVLFLVIWFGVTWALAQILFTPAI